MGTFEAIATTSVRAADLRNLLAARGIEWQSAAHVTATGSLARPMREDEAMAVSIASIIDLIVMPGMSDGLEMPIDTYPGPNDLKDRNKYDKAVRAWKNEASGKRVRLGLQFDEQLRQYVRSELSDDEGLQRVLIAARRDLYRTFQTLASSGFKPSDLSPTDRLANEACRAWSTIEETLPNLGVFRRDLWPDLTEYEAGATDQAIELKTRVTSAIETAFGALKSTKAMVFHGFYFFTPPQWALFQLLKRTPGIDVLFVVHDDGASPVFETWRRFFLETWGMPTPTLSTTPLTAGPPATALLRALRGASLHDSKEHNLTVLECRSPTDLIRRWMEEARTDDEESPTRRFAAQAETISGFARRLGNKTGTGPADLAQLPVGAYLLAIHDCIVPRPSGGADIRIRGENLLRIVASGFLNRENSGAPTRVATLRRCLPFFQGCTSPSEWRDRAELLKESIEGPVTALGARLELESDRVRIRRAIGNPLRLAPWADLTKDESSWINSSIIAVTELLEEIAGQETIELGNHLRFLRRELQRGMAGLPEADRQEIESKLQGFSLEMEEELDVGSVIDVVRMLLGRRADLEIDGTEDPDEDGPVSELRGLDALGYRKAKGHVHLANLVEGSFPSAVRVPGWPFQMNDLAASNSKTNAVAVEILQARVSTAGLSDLYLLWLALDGVEPGRTVTLSWLTQIGREPRNPSSLVTLLTEPANVSASVKEAAGGLRVERVSTSAEKRPVTECPQPAPSDTPWTNVERSVSALDTQAAAVSLVCSRRFAIQWALGPTAAYQAPHHQSMLYGNVEGALVKQGKDVRWTEEACSNLWAFLTAGQRQSSLAKRVVIPGQASAPPAWLLTLGGGKNSNHPMSPAYLAARNKESPEPTKIAQEAWRFLPPGVHDHEICQHCPVRSRCSHAGYKDEGQ